MLCGDLGHRLDRAWVLGALGTRGLSPRQSSVLFVLPPVSGPVVVTSALTQGKLTHIEVAVLAQGHRVEKQSKDPGHLSLDGANSTKPAAVP